MSRQMKFPDYLPCKYETYKDAYDRINHTLCRYDGTVVFVTVQAKTSGPNPDFHLNLHTPDANYVVAKNIKINDPLLDVSVIEVGYYNHVDSAGNSRVFYASRGPKKQYRQGTTVQMLSISAIDGSSCDKRHTLTSAGFYKSLENIFPQPEKINLGEEIAISQDIALRRDNLGVLEVYWRTVKIAVKVPGAPVHKIETEFTWLLDKVLGGLDGYLA